MATPLNGKAWKLALTDWEGMPYVGVPQPPDLTGSCGDPYARDRAYSGWG